MLSVSVAVRVPMMYEEAKADCFVFLDLYAMMTDVCVCFVRFTCTTEGIVNAST
jgi:hypothetical protein